MRNSEEFKSLVYCKRDRLLQEEADRKIKFNKKIRFYSVASSAIAACIALAIILPNMGFWSGLSEAPRESEGQYMEDMEGAFSSDEAAEIAPPAENEPQRPGDMDPAESMLGIKDPDETQAEVVPGGAHDGDQRFFVKHTQTLSTEPMSGISYTGRLIGRLTGTFDREYQIITDFEELDRVFGELCGDLTAAGSIGRDVFDEYTKRMVVVVARDEGDPGDNEVIYSNAAFADGVLYLDREYTYSGEYDVPAVEVRCVDFVVINLDSFDPSEITFVDIIKKGENR